LLHRAHGECADGVDCEQIELAVVQEYALLQNRLPRPVRRCYRVLPNRPGEIKNMSQAGATRPQVLKSRPRTQLPHAPPTSHRLFRPAQLWPWLTPAESATGRRDPRRKTTALALRCLPAASAAVLAPRFAGLAAASEHTSVRVTGMLTRWPPRIA